MSHDQTAVAEFDAWPAERVRLSDRTLSVRSAPPTAPNAEPAVLVHGLGGSALNWTDLMGLLADRLDSRAPDLSGFGESPPPDDGDYSMAAHARSVVALIEADGRVLTREQLMDAVYGDGEAYVLDRTIDALVKRLREKLEDDAERPRYLATVRGVGYRAARSGAGSGAG